MIKSRPIFHDRDRVIGRAAEILERMPRVVFGYLFGGLARGSRSPLSDIDIAVYLEDGTDLIEEKLNLIGNLTDGLETDEIDLVILNTAPLPLQIRVIREKVILIDRRPFERHAFESLVMRKYFDFSMKEEAILRRRFFHGRSVSSHEEAR